MSLALNASSEYLPEIFKVHFVDRIKIGDGWSVAGDNRTPLIDNSRDILSTFSEKEMIGGRGPFCIRYPNDYPCFVPGSEIGANPLQPIVSYGIIGSLPYMMSLGWSLITIIRGNIKSIIPMAFFLMLIQRPFTMSFGYSILIFLILFYIDGRRARTRLGWN